MEAGSYMLIERGMTVHGTDGDLGTVAEVVADEGADVFRGIVLAHGLLGLKHAFVPGEQVVRVEHNSVYVSLFKDRSGKASGPSGWKPDL